ncbi:hypothetical protein J5N97_007798 [Dioscorea zingiberensis]|uniref:Protein kinase domain-containing protein n=1 Tax=Dioscorea zingiberensis TaxID=325984 RepID=A0A9D5DG46_9LILI|nr:hypothetical protein J5N97_007798 [Dioscorea zingiberensis]
MESKSGGVVLLFSVSFFFIAGLASDSDALRRLVSDLGLRQQRTHPCNTPGIGCERRGSALRVTSIDLPSGRLDGILSPSIGRLSELRELSLPGNLLSGLIPREISRCRALEILDLRGNRLSGPVPSDLSSLTSLRVLNLSSNLLTGDLDFLIALPNLEQVSLSRNLFSGQIPQSLSSLRNLISIDLSNNPDLYGESTGYGLRRSLIPKRYVFAENNNSNKSHRASTAAAIAPAPGPSASPHHHRRNRKKRVRNWLIGFLVGSISGVISGLALSVLFRMTMNCIRGRYKNPAGPSIYSPLIKRAEDLSFLEKDEGLAALELIGSGGCGQVYKGQLPPPDPSHPDVPGKLIAIKKIMKITDADAAELGGDENSKVLDKFKRQIRSEIRTVGQIRHRNLLPLLAHVPRPDCDLLVYEYMKNGSLDNAMAEGGLELDWIARHRIALGVASGLEYLHMQHSPRIIHRDLKPGNILLDDNMEARIGDFGLAKQVPDANTHMTTSNVAGTVGYIAPEYHQLLKFTDKCDIYSFGVILGVLVIGKQPSDDFFQETEEMSLVKWMRNVMRSVNPTVAIDPKLIGNGYEEQMLLVLRIACFCTADDPKERPNSKDVRCMLSQIKH